VQHDDGRTSTANPNVEGRAIGFDLFGVKTRWELLKFGHAIIPTIWYWP
jgi:hypothetical protein